MPYRVMRAVLVKADIVRALNYYDSISFSLGRKFEVELKDAFGKLELTPHNYFNLKYGFRRIALERFPYMIIYTIEEETVLVRVWGVFHQHSNPASMYRKIKER